MIATERTEDTEDTEKNYSVLLSVLCGRIEGTDKEKKSGNQFCLVVIYTATFDVIRFDNAHVVKGHCKRDHKHVINNDAVEVEFISLKHIYNELLDLIEQNRGVIDETKRR